MKRALIKKRHGSRVVQIKPLHTCANAQLVSHCDVNAVTGPGGWISCKSGHCSKTQSSVEPPPFNPRPLTVSTQDSGAAASQKIGQSR